MQSLGRRYVAFFNYSYARSGTLFEGRFRSSVVQEDRYFLTCLRYIELNPVREGVNRELDTDTIARIRHCANTGLVLGTEKFRAQVAALTA